MPDPEPRSSSSSSSSSSVQFTRVSSLWSNHDEQELHALVDSAFAYLRAHHPDCNEECTFGINLAEAASVRELNATHRAQDHSTNVLAFPVAPLPFPNGEPRHLGDVVLAYETINDEARKYDIPSIEHAIHLAIHGLLHLLGHDHHRDNERLKMELWEINTLNALGYPNPYEISP